MNRRALAVLARLAVAFGSTILAFWLLIDPWRNVEASTVSALFRALGSPAAGQAFGNQILVIPTHSSPFLATISPSCSALAAVLAFGAIATFVVRGDPLRRLMAFGAAAGLVLVCNFIRICLSVYVGIQTNAQGLTVFHDWIGTAFGILYVLGGFTLFLWVLLPSNRTLLKEYANESR
jgi:exosortase/archaeosortase family protein